MREQQVQMLQEAGHSGGTEKGCGGREQGQDHSGALGSPGGNEDLLKAAGHDWARSSPVLCVWGTGRRMSQPSRKFPSDSLTLK